MIPVKIPDPGAPPAARGVAPGIPVETVEAGTPRPHALLLRELPEPGLTGEVPAVPAKSVVVNAIRGGRIDARVVSRRFYNRLNLPGLAGAREGESVAIGVTSVHPREGKTLVACNLAVSLAVGSGAKTAILDCHTGKPRVHLVFGVPLRPGLLDALDDEAIHLSSSRIDRLSVLPAGDHRTGNLGLDDLPPLNGVMHALREAHRFVIVDLPPLADEEMTESIVAQLNGVIVVVDTRRTRRRDIDRAFRRLPGELVLGFVFNRVNDNEF